MAHVGWAILTAVSPGPDDAGDRPREALEPRPLPTSLVPRWLAWVVLIALLSSAGFSVCALLGAPAGQG